MKTKTDIRQERVAVANQVIAIMADHGRRFFSSDADHRERNPDRRISRFELVDGRLWFIDKYTCARIYVAYRRGRWKKFSDGGTLRALVCAMADWIMGKKEKFPMHFGPWPESLCGGDLWGYGKEEMEIVRQKIAALLNPTNPSPISQEIAENIIP